MPGVASPARWSKVVPGEAYFLPTPSFLVWHNYTRQTRPPLALVSPRKTRAKKRSARGMSGKSETEGKGWAVREEARYRVDNG